MYTPVSQRKTTAGETQGYIPVAERTSAIENSPAEKIPPVSSGEGMEFRVGEGLNPEQTALAYSKILTPDVTKIPFENTALGVAKNTVTGIPAASLTVEKNILNFGKDTLQSIARSVGSAALTIAGRFGSTDKSNVANSLKPEDFHNNFTQALFENVFGKDTELKPIETRIAEAEPKIKSFGDELDQLSQNPNLNFREKIVVNALSNLAKNNPQSLAFTGIMGSVGMDLTSFGGLEENAARQIVNARNLGDALILGQKLGISTDLLDNFAEQVVKTNTLKEASTLLKSTGDLMQTTKVAPVKAVAEGVTDIPHYVPVAERPKLLGDMDAATNYAKEMRPEVKAPIPKDLEPLAVEARKYKSAEEFTVRIKDLVMKKKNGIELLDDQKAFLEALSKPEIRDLKPSEIFDKAVGSDTNSAGKFIANNEPKFPKVAKIEKAAARAKAGENFGPRTNQKTAVIKKPGVISVPKNMEMPPKLVEQQSKIQGYNEMINEAKGRLADHPGKKLQDFISKKTGQFEDFRNPELAKTPSEKAAIIERNKKTMAASMKALEGTPLSDQFDNPDTIRKTIDEYKNLKESLSGMSQQRVEAKRAYFQARKEFLTKELDRRSLNGLVARQERVKVLEEVQKILRKEGRDRKEKIDAIADYFNLTDAEMKKLNTGNKDYRLMTDKEFENHMKAIEGKAYEAAAHRKAVMEIENTIHDLELIKTDNLREAMKLKKFENMSKNELESFDNLLQTFKKGDEFLGKRQLQTVRLTDMAGIKTKREALQFLAKEAKVPLEELKNIQVGELDKFLYDNPLARKNPFYKVMVDNVNLAEVSSSARFFEIKKETENLFKASRSSRKQSLIDRFIPSDHMIWDYLSGDADTKLEYAKRMTPQEYKAAIYIQDNYAKVRDYLLEQEVLKKFRANYITHIRRDFLEAWKDGARGATLTKGFKAAVKEIFDVYKQNSAVFNILDTKTGEVLPLEKFFKFSMSRSGNLVPTKNVSKAFLEYMRVFEQKRQLDSFIPKLDIFAHVLSPQALTPRGLEFDDSLKRFVKTWINSKKGRTMDMGVIKQGEKIDWALRSGVALTRLLDLGLNIPVGLASNVGEQAFNFIELGAKKYATGLARYATKQGREIVNSYENIVGEKFFAKMADTSKSAGEKFHEGLFSLFSVANRRANAVHLLADMTPEEFRAGKLSTQKLAEIRNNIAKYHVVPGKESIVGKTSLGGVGKQYKSWAVPAFHTTIDNLKKVSQMVKAKDFQQIKKSKEFAELFRGTLLTATLLVTSYGYYDHLQNKKDRSFLENLAYKSMNDAFSFISSLNPAFWFLTPRLEQFLADLGLSLSNIATSLATGDRTKQGDITGFSKLKATITPSIVKQVSKIGGAPPDKSSPNKAGLPKFPGLPNLPKLPQLPKL